MKTHLPLAPKIYELKFDDFRFLIDFCEICFCITSNSKKILFELRYQANVWHQHFSKSCYICFWILNLARIFFTLILRCFSERIAFEWFSPLRFLNQARSNLLQNIDLSLMFFCMRVTSLLITFTLKFSVECSGFWKLWFRPSWPCIPTQSAPKFRP